MKTDRAAQLRHDVQMALDDVIEQAIADGLTAAQMEAARQGALHVLPRDAPERIRIFLEGYWEARLLELNRHYLVYGGWWAVPPAMLQGRPELQARAGVFSTLHPDIPELRPCLFVTTEAHRPEFVGALGLDVSIFALGGPVRQKGYWWPPRELRKIWKPWWTSDTDENLARPWVSNVID